MEAKMFKTNINCSSCVEKVTATLNKVIGEDNWQVDTTSPLKLLTVDNDCNSTHNLQQALSIIGYKAELL